MKEIQKKTKYPPADPRDSKEPVWIENEETGLLELVDGYGKVVTTEKASKESGKRRLSRWDSERYKGTNRFHWVVVPGGKRYWVPKGYNPDEIPLMAYPYAQVTADAIVEQIIEGKNLAEISELEGFPPRHVIYRWTRVHSDFKEKLAEAKKYRAEYYAEEVIRVAKKSKKNTAEADRVKIDALKWSAEMGDRENYGKQTKLTGDAEKPLGFVILTGVPLEEPAPAIAVESRNLDEEPDDAA